MPGLREFSGRTETLIYLVGVQHFPMRHDMVGRGSPTCLHAGPETRMMAIAALPGAVESA